MSLLADLPVGAIERALVHDTGDQILVITKSIGFSWKSTKAILLLSGAKSSDYLDSFNKLKPETAKSAIQFYRLRERATKAKPK